MRNRAFVFIGTVCLFFVWPWALEVNDLSPFDITEQQFLEFQKGMKPEYTSYLGFTHNLVFSPKLFPLKTPLGNYNGYPYKQRVSLAVLDSTLLAKQCIGFLYFYQREGWETKDFLLFRNEDAFSHGYSSHLMGGVYTIPEHHFLLSGGAVWQNLLHQNIYANSTYDDQWLYWGRVELSMIGAAVLAEQQIYYASFSLELQDRKVRETGLWEYGPDLQFLYRDNFERKYRLFWNQNIWNQRLYLKSAFALQEKRFLYGIFNLNLDETHFLSADVSVFVDENEDWYWGGQLKLPFLRVAYSYAEDYSYFPYSKEKWVVELYLDFSFNKGYFAPGAPQRGEETKRNVEKKHRFKR